MAVLHEHFQGNVQGVHGYSFKAGFGNVAGLKQPKY